MWLLLAQTEAGAGTGAPALHEVRITADEGVQLEGDEWLPPREPRPAAGILLVHASGTNRKAWGELPAALARAGYRVVAIDLRGQGSSPGASAAAGDPSVLETDPSLAPADLRAGLAWLRAAPGADVSRLGVIGAGVGANLACVASGLGLTRTAVALSPDRDRAHLLAGHRPLHMQSLLLLATSGDPGRETEARRLYLEARQPKDVHVFTGTGETGEAILAARPEAVDMILEWLRRTL